MDGLIQTPQGSTFPTVTMPLHGGQQYGPAWVADCYGSSHSERCLVLLRAEEETGTSLVTTYDDQDHVAVAYAGYLDATVFGQDSVMNQAHGSSRTKGQG